nr:hypothetical protein TCT1_36330 [Xenorhabdus sp. TCT-1]
MINIGVIYINVGVRMKFDMAETVTITLSTLFIANALIADKILWLEFLKESSFVLTIMNAKHETPIDTINILIVCSAENALITNPDMAAPKIVLIEFTKPLILKALSVSFPVYKFGIMLEPIG